VRWGTPSYAHSLAILWYSRWPNLLSVSSPSVLFKQFLMNLGNALSYLRQRRFAIVFNDFAWVYSPAAIECNLS
jgi:hypothetical protein